jgi:hypothetical protein
MAAPPSLRARDWLAFYKQLPQISEVLLIPLCPVE